MHYTPRKVDTDHYFGCSRVPSAFVQPADSTSAHSKLANFLGQVPAKNFSSKYGSSQE